MEVGASGREGPTNNSSVGTIKRNCVQPVRVRMKGLPPPSLPPTPKDSQLRAAASAVRQRMSDSEKRRVVGEIG